MLRNFFYIGLYEQTDFRNNFRHLERTCTFTFMHFADGTLPQGQNNFQNKFSQQVLYNNCSNKNWEVFKSVFK